MKLKILGIACLLLTFQGCIKVQDTGDSGIDNPPQTQGVVFNANGSIFGATKSGKTKDSNNRQSLYTNRLVGSIDQDAIVYNADSSLIGICVGRNNTAFDSKGYLVGECDLINQ